MNDRKALPNLGRMPCPQDDRHGRPPQRHFDTGINVDKVEAG